ncbi:MAG: hypothetical protein KatS3mg111_0068 [Pirellulaceae bacterium]|nr:MAG: hypothetical protein KatS3mg111_0068 [Pirellulaceae bacterium]
MPIKIKCSQCGKVLAVPDTMAGKKGKCKCGNVLNIPAAQKAKAPRGAVAGGINPSAFDALDEEDFQQQAPVDKLFAAPKGDGESERLKMYAAEEKERRKQEATKTKMLIKFISVLHILGGIGFCGLAATLWSAPDQLNTIASYLPMVKANTNLIAAFSIAWGLLMIAAAIGGFLVHKWGWFLLAASVSYLFVDRGATLAFTLTEGFDQIRFYSALIPLLIAFGFVIAIFREQTRDVFRLRTMLPVILAGMLGMAVGIGVVMVTYQAVKAERQASRSTVTNVFAGAYDIDRMLPTEGRAA